MRTVSQGDVFLICSWVEMRSVFSYSAILISHAESVININSISRFSSLSEEEWGGVENSKILLMVLSYW